jgi:uncharacterized protein (TIGR02118 family)
MVKMVILLERREDMSFEEFEEYYRTEHAPLVEEMDEVERYVIDFPTDPEKSAYDAVAELYFEDVGALSAGFGSEAGRAVEADAENFASDQTTLIVEESVQFDR